ncbi:MAG: sigma-70 family RNA polymerase sigma factor, partial [Ktedonobacterales bacterium]|nr:sigma-70 family RNA polymerase sigma factor [Ktedonobacterales bacterium]
SCSTTVLLGLVPHSKHHQEHTTDSPTHELLSPYASIERLPRLTAEEEARLLADLRVASRAPAAKARLIEGYLPRVLTLAKQYDRRYRVITFDDLVQEGSLALMQAIDKCATMPIAKSLSRYVGTVVRSAFSRAIGTDAPIHMPNSTWHYIHKTGRAQQYAWMQTMRLDAMRNAEGETFAEAIPAPALLLSAGEQEQERQYDERCRQLMPLLAMLSDRRRRVLTLRYGLDPADARCHSREETARLLGLSPGTVYDAEQRAIVTLRRLYETMTATGAVSSPETLTVATSPARGRPRKPITAGQRQYHQRQHAEQQAKLEAAFRSMQEQGLPITGLSLKRAAQVNYKAACAFVQAHCPQNAERARLRAMSVQQRLEEAFAQMVARGETLSITALKAAAHTGAPEARAFLRSRGVPRQW